VIVKKAPELTIPLWEVQVGRALHTWILGNAERLAMPRNLDVSLRENALQPERNNTQQIERRKRSAPTAWFLFVLCCVQILAKHSSGPVRNRLGDFAQFAADELRHHFVAAAMRGVVVHE
jgi:hypothetical protein